MQSAPPMQNAEKRHNVWYAYLDIPADVRQVIGKRRFFKSTQTGSEAQARPRIIALVAGWRDEIAKARKTLPDPKAGFWETLRRDYIEAYTEDAQLVVQEVAEVAAAKVRDPEEATRLYKYATDQLGTLLAPLVADWKDSLKLAPKTVDQRFRDVSLMAAHFVSLEALLPRGAKLWTDKLVKDGMTASSFARLGDGCRSFWSYLKDAGLVAVELPDPFSGAFRLASRKAPAVKAARQAFTAEEIARVYQAAKTKGDTPLADLIALGAYTGARIEELCSLTLDTSKDGVFVIEDAKTDAGNREVPIHPKLKALVTRLRKDAKDGYLVPSTAEGKYGVRSDPLSKRFGHLKTALEFGREHVFHSIRKTVATQLEQAGVAEGIAADVLGHEKKTLSYGLYSAGSSMKDKAKAVAKLAYAHPLDRP